MDHIRGEKVSFGKDDFHPLDQLPSAMKPDAVVLATPKKRNLYRTCSKIVLLAMALCASLVGLLFFSLEEGFFDDVMTAKAEDALSHALGSDFDPKVRSVRLRFSENWLLAFAAGDVEVKHKSTGISVLKTDRITAVLDPLSLLRGRVSLMRAEIGSAEADLRFLPAQAPIDWKSIRIDSIPELMNGVYPGLDGFLDFLRRSETEHVVAHQIALKLPQATKLGDTVKLNELDFRRPDETRYVLSANLDYGEISPQVSLVLGSDKDKTSSIDLNISNLAAAPILMKKSKLNGERRYGIDLPLDIGISASRQNKLLLRVHAGAGQFYADGITEDVKAGDGLLSYNFKDRKFELTRGLIDLGRTRLPAEGALIDLDRREPGKPHGYAFNVISNNAQAASENVDGAPEPFNMRAGGYFLPETRQLMIDEMGINAGQGSFAGSLSVTFAEPSPAVNFAARTADLNVSSLKQLWPYWFAHKVRRWVLENVSGGKIARGEIDISLAAGRIPEHPIPLVFKENEIRISLDAEDTSIRYIDTMPPTQKTSGHLEMRDRNVKVAIASGIIPLPSGKKITSNGGTFEVPDISAHPIMADLDLKTMSDASAAVELANFKPIEAGKRLPFKPADISGDIAAQISATFGLDKEQNPPRPDYAIALDLKNVDIKTPIQNKHIANLAGALNFDRSAASLKAKADIDGIPLNVSGTEPLEQGSDVKRVWAVDGTINSKEIAKLSPSLSDYLNGEVGVSLKGEPDGDQRADLDLTGATLSVPVVGWKKGTGVPAQVTFSLKSNEGISTLDDFVLSGDGFGASGAMRVDAKGLVSAKFSRIRLSASDNYALSVQRKSGGLSINVDGDSIDLRPLLDRLKAGAAQGDGGEGGGGGASHSITARLGRAIGYNKEYLGNVVASMSTKKGTFSRLSLDAVTSTGQAIVMRKDSDAGAIELTSGDAGAVARFADLYRNMRGGLLNVSLKSKDADSWRGRVDIRSFALVNEERLKSIVSSRSGSNGQSLSDAIKTDINTNSQKFRRAFARVLVDGSQVRVENGIVRGDQVGATFQGTVRDGNSRMNLTGTFMPAYGLNSLFGQLPIIGDILGNGRDRGLLGITFRLDGPYEQPRLTVNPLSIIAPGVFRNIFEFE